jgi:hypothetical protein
MFLGVGKHDYDNQNYYDTSGYDILHHGCHSTGLAHYDDREDDQALE